MRRQKATKNSSNRELTPGALSGKCHHSPSTSVMRADTMRAETSMLGLFMLRVLEIHKFARST
jgi:hypothetical protein